VLGKSVLHAKLRVKEKSLITLLELKFFPFPQILLTKLIPPAQAKLGAIPLFP
jgi:hypothetical protein